MTDVTQHNETEQGAGQNKKKKNEAWEWIKSLLIAFGLALLIRYFLFAIFMVEGTSMVPTLQDQERLVVNKIVYQLHNPEYNDIVVFQYPADPEKDFVKRVIGLPGDKIEVRDYKVFRNGQELDETYINEPTSTYYGSWEVPADTVFVLGDNRNHSKDSRDPQVGFVPFDLIVGRAEVVWWPIQNFRNPD